MSNKQQLIGKLKEFT